MSITQTNNQQQNHTVISFSQFSITCSIFAVRLHRSQTGQDNAKPHTEAIMMFMDLDWKRNNGICFIILHVNVDISFCGTVQAEACMASMLTGHSLALLLHERPLWY